MIALPPQLIRSIRPTADVRFDMRPLQLGLGGCPWRIAVASMLLCRTRRAQAEAALRKLLARWPTAADLARSDGEELQSAVRPCGLQRNRARQLQRFSVRFLGDGWSDMRELVGVGPYVADAVGLFCFGCTELESKDTELCAYCLSLASTSSAAPS